MDPRAALDQLDRADAERLGDECREIAQDFFEWIDRGGFWPPMDANDWGLLACHLPARKLTRLFQLDDERERS